MTREISACKSINIMVKRTFDVETDAGHFHIEVDGGDLLMYGKLSHMPDDGHVTFSAAAPVDYRASFSGSGLPFADRDQAFYATPNSGTAAVHHDGSFEIRMATPASYYAGLGTVLVRPTVFLTFELAGKRTVTHVSVDDPVAFRLGTYPHQFTNARDSPAFYRADSVLPRTQEEILRASAYPLDNETPKNFWGTKPPV